MQKFPFTVEEAGRFGLEIGSTVSGDFFTSSTKF
jgi:hypothetical protein